MNGKRIALTTISILACGAVISGCSSTDKVPSGDVATVGSTGISKTVFDRWLKLAAGEKNAQQQDPGEIIVPDPPSYQSCIAAQRAQIAKDKKKSQLTEKDLKQGCETQYDQLKSQVMSFLIRSEWLNKQAEELGIDIPEAKIKAALNQARQQAFPNTEDYKAYLKNSGQTEADLLYRQRSQMLEERITQVVNNQAKKVSQDEVDRYYQKNRSQFTQPAVRTLNLVMTETEGEAQQAKRAVEAGQPWDKVADKYSIDPTSKSNGGILAGVSQGSQEKTLDKAIFAAPTNQIEGPLKTPQGYYIFKVTSETPEKIQSLERLQDSIVQIVASERQQKAIQQFGKQYQARWRAETLCQADYLVPECSNYKAAN